MNEPELIELSPEEGKAALRKTALDISVAAEWSPGGIFVNAAHGAKDSFFVLKNLDGEVTVWRCTDPAEIEARRRIASFVFESIGRRFGQ